MDSGILIDTHCHINSLDEHSREELFVLGEKRFIFVDVSTDSSSARLSVVLSSQYSFIYSCLGFHPLGAHSFKEEVIDEFEELVHQSKKVVGIGEIGIDYKSQASFEMQVKVFKRFIELARGLDLPIVVHNRWNSLSLFDILDGYFSSYRKIIFHCFSQDRNTLERILRKDGWVSFSLNILRGKKELIEALKVCPLENLLLETDSPYVFINRKKSHPLNIKDVYNFVAQVKNISLEELSQIILVNARKVFKI
ncbi:MAG: TatD family hydrolase [Candidatus Omnitrophica bacterium]|nr:TatD family hydrolase [Candidatus Omnitrophota bacterium]